MLVGIVQSPSEITDFWFSSLLRTFVFQIIALSGIVVINFSALLSHCDANRTVIYLETPKLYLTSGLAHANSKNKTMCSGK